MENKEVNENYVTSKSQESSLNSCSKMKEQIKSATLHFHSSPFRPTNLTIELEDNVLRLQTLGVSTIRNHNVSSGKAHLSSEVKDFIGEAKNVSTENKDGYYQLNFFDCEQHKLGDMQFPINGYVPVQDLIFS